MCKTCTLNTSKHSAKILKDLSKWRHIPYSWIRRLNIVQMSFFPKLIYRLNAIPNKISTGFSVKIQSTENHQNDFDKEGS